MKTRVLPKSGLLLRAAINSEHKIRVYHEKDETKKTK